LLPFIGTFEDVQVEFGVGVGVSSLFENPPLRGPLSHVWVSIACVSPSSYSSSSASSSSSLCLRLHPPRYVFSRSLNTTSRCLCMSLYLLCASPLECFCNKSRDRCKADSPLRTSRAVPHPQF
jgi:hypothetical protein